MMEEGKRHGNKWFLLPIFLHIVGGLIAYFVLKDEDKPKAKNCLYLGVALTAATAATTAVSVLTGDAVFGGIIP